MALGRRSKTSKEKIKLAEETEKALDLKRAGLSIRKIAEALKVSVGKAHELVERGIRDIPQATRDALVHEVHERQLALIATHWPRRLNPESAKIIQASDKQLRELLGLDAPRKNEVTGKDGGPISFDLSRLSDDQLDRLATGDTTALEGASDDGEATEGDREDPEPA